MPLVDLLLVVAGAWLLFNVLVIVALSRAARVWPGLDLSRSPRQRD